MDKNLQKYVGLWVALESDEKTVVAISKTIKEAWEKARKKCYMNYYVSCAERDFTNILVILRIKSKLR